MLRKQTHLWTLTAILTVSNIASAHPLELKNEHEKMIHRRAVEVAIWGMPAVGVRGFYSGGVRDLGADWNQVVYFSTPMDSKHGFLTPNNQVPYVAPLINTKHGPMVMELPAASEKAKYFGSLADRWHVPFTDVGPDGADGGKGAKYLLLPPGYTGTVPDEGYIVFRPSSHAVYGVLRPVANPGATLDDQVAYLKTLKLYPYEQEGNPPETNFIDAYYKKWDTLPKYDLRFYEDLAAALDEEPVLARDKAMMAMARSIGIEKGKPFQPDARTAKILENAIQEAYDYMHHLFVENAFAVYIPDTQWSVFNLSPTQSRLGFPFETDYELLLDQRARFYHYATFLPKILGGSSFYLCAIKDANGEMMNGNSTYKMTVPADTPAGDFWSAIAYSSTTHGFIAGSPRVGISSLDKDTLKVSDDGSVDLYFAPEAPDGLESNWIPTGEDFWIIMRLYGPKPALFDGSWTINDVTKIE